MVEDNLNWEQTQAIEKEGKLNPELIKEYKEQGRKKQSVKVIETIQKEEQQKEEAREMEEFEIYKQLQEDYVKKEIQLSNELFMLQMKVMKKLAEKSREGINSATELLVDYIE